MADRVTVLDYGMCNLLNVVRALEHIGASVVVTEDPALALAAERLVVPGVGAFRDSIHEIEARGFGDAIKRFVALERPFLGICVGMQVLFDGSDEFGDNPGLGILGGRVERVPETAASGEAQRVPHIGWNHLVEPQAGRPWTDTLLTPFAERHPAVYFVHSFAAVPTDPGLRLADTVYGGHRLCAAIQRGTLMATQFHPERSGEAGLSVLRSFTTL